MLKIAKILMDYEVAQCGIDHMPQFGWILESDKRNVTQEAYELEIALDKAFRDFVYQSGKKESDASAQIEVRGVELTSVTRYHVRARAWADGEETGWAETSFVTGILSPGEWEASFITAETEADAAVSKGTCVRKEFTVDGKVKEAFVCVTALGLYNFYLNGKKVGGDELTPGWTSYNKHLCYQTYEVTEYLKEGLNAAGAMLGAGWYKGVMGFTKQRNHYGTRTALLSQMVIRYEDGREEKLITDASWKGFDAPVVFAEIYDGEIYEAEKEIDGWAEPGTDGTAFGSVSVIDVDKAILSGQGAGKVCEMDEVPAKRIFKTPQGDTVIDFGQNMTGRIHVKAHGKPGDVIELHCFEVLDAAGNVYLDNLRGAKEAMKYTFAEEKDVEYTVTFTFMGFQYAKIVSYPGEPKAENFTAYTLHSRMERSGWFGSSDPDLNQLAHNILWGLKGNFVDVPTDCPQRDERLGWTGDAQIFCRTACWLMNTYNFYRKWLRDLEADQTPDGGVPHVVPDILNDPQEMKENWLLKQGQHSAAGWADAAVINPWTMYLTFGDTEILKIQYKSMKGWIDFMQAHSDDYIWSYALQYGDWVALDAEEGSYFGATPTDLTCTAYFAYSTGLFVKAAEILGYEEDAKKYTELYEHVVDKFQHTYFDQEGNMTAQTQTSHILALYFNLVPEKYRKKTVQGLLRLLEKENGHLVTGFLGTPYFCHALSQNGHVKEAYDLLLKDDFPSWLYQVKMGATTVWEHWDGLRPDGTMWSPDMNSFNHYAYGAIGEWMIRVAAGIEVDEKEPGYKHSILYPRIGGGLEWIKGEYDSVYGPVKTCWEDLGDTAVLHVEVPVNTTATVCLDGAKEVKEADGLSFVPGDGCMTAETGSGKYKIVFVK